MVLSLCLGYVRPRTPSILSTPCKRGCVLWLNQENGIFCIRQEISSENLRKSTHFSSVLLPASWLLQYSVSCKVYKFLSSLFVMYLCMDGCECNDGNLFFRNYGNRLKLKTGLFVSFVWPRFSQFHPSNCLITFPLNERMIALSSSSFKEKNRQTNISSSNSLYVRIHFK